MNYLVEIKNEYTITLVNILTPLIYQGIDSIYKDAKKISDKDNALKNFQVFLRSVPKWNNDLIENETNRIMSNCRCADWLHDLIKAVIKSNIIILTNNSGFKKESSLDKSYYQDISMNDFIHKVYIECAREVYNNPYLFYDEYQPIDLKRNQREALNLIKDAIKEGIRKLLPVKLILKEYLGNNFTKETYENFEYSVSEANSKNIKNLLQKDMNVSQNVDQQNQANFDLRKIETLDKPTSPINFSINNNLDMPPFSPSENKNLDNEDITLDNILENHKPNQLGGNIEELKNMNKEDFINQLKEEEKRESNKKSSYAASSDDVTTLLNQDKINSIKGGSNTNKPDEEKIRSILENELYNNVSDESDTSISYTHGNFNDESFEDVFSNVNGENANSKNDIASIASEIFLNNLIKEDTPKKRKSKQEYFSKYMKV